MTDTKRPTVTIDYDAKPIEFEAVWRDHGGKTREELEWLHVARAWRDYVIQPRGRRRR